MGYFQVMYDSRVVNYDHRGFIGLATGGQPYCDTSPYGECSLYHLSSSLSTINVCPIEIIHIERV